MYEINKLTKCSAIYVFIFNGCEIVLKRNTLLNAKRENVALLSLQKAA